MHRFYASMLTCLLTVTGAQAACTTNKRALLTHNPVDQATIDAFGPMAGVMVTSLP